MTEEDGYLKIVGSIDEEMVDTESRYWIQVRTADGQVRFTRRSMWAKADLFCVLRI